MKSLLETGDINFVQHNSVTNFYLNNCMNKDTNNI